MSRQRSPNSSDWLTPVRPGHPPPPTPRPASRLVLVALPSPSLASSTSTPIRTIISRESRRERVNRFELHQVHCPHGACRAIGRALANGLALATFRSVMEALVELALMIGLQGAGKSTSARAHFAEDYVFVSRDLLRNNRHRNERQLQLIEEALRERRSVVVDNTHATIADRAPMLALGHRYG